MGRRKYGHRGYQEEERRGDPKPRGRRPERHGPGGRGLGAPRETVFKCSRCGARRPAAGLDPGAVCGACGTDLHSCVNCRFLDSAAPNECRAGVEERIAAKAKGNDCALFEPKLVQDHAADSGADDDPRAAFDALFDF